VCHSTEWAGAHSAHQQRLALLFVVSYTCAMFSVACRCGRSIPRRGMLDVRCHTRPLRHRRYMRRFIVNHDELEHALRTRSDADPSFVFATLNFDALTTAMPVACAPCPATVAPPGLGSRREIRMPPFKLSSALKLLPPSN
jgi:hypothetical protein